MLQLEIGGNELYDEENCEFITLPKKTVQLEHSLYSVRKWESKWHKSFLKTLEEGKLTPAEMKDYVRCMCLSPKIEEDTFNSLDRKAYSAINKYLADPMTATTFSKNPENGAPPRREVITAELVYYYMLEYGIPFECQKWNFNQLMTLIRVCQIKGQPSKMMRGRELAQSNQALNAARRKQHRTRG